MSKEEMEQKSILDTQMKGVTVKIAWQFFAGWTSLVVFAIYAFLNLKSEITDLGLGQSRIDAIQDIRIDANKQANDLQNLEIKNLQEQLNELNQKNKP